MKKIYKKKLKYQSGIALVEVIASLGIAVLAITALVSLSISTLRTSLESKLLLEGSKVANKQMELVRAYRDSRSWDEFITGVEGCDTACNLVGGTLSGGSGASGTSSTEKIYFQFIATDTNGVDIDPGSPPDVVRISVSTKWVIGDKVKGAYVYTDLSNWRLE